MDTKPFSNSMTLAVTSAKETGERYFVMEPWIANPGLKKHCHLTVGVIHEDELAINEIESVALTVFPSGVIRNGYCKSENG